jgi:hypothetical protein
MAFLIALSSVSKGLASAKPPKANVVYFLVDDMNRQHRFCGRFVAVKNHIFNFDILMFLNLKFKIP